MLKKLFAVMLAAVGFAAVNAAEKVQLQLNVLQDSKAEFEVIEVSENVKANAKPHPFKKIPGRGQGFVVTLEAEGETEIAIKLKISGKGLYFLSGCGFGAKGKQIPIRCTKLEINGRAFVPDANGKPFDFNTWRKLTGKDNLSLDGSEELTIRASFVRPANK